MKIILLHSPMINYEVDPESLANLLSSRKNSSTVTICNIHIVIIAKLEASQLGRYPGVSLLIGNINEKKQNKLN